MSAICCFLTVASRLSSSTMLMPIFIRVRASSAEASAAASSRAFASSAAA